MRIYILNIWNALDLGAMTSYHTTELGANQQLAAFVCEKWDLESMRGSSPSGNIDRDIEDFFYVMAEGYSFALEEKIVQGPEVAEEEPLGPDEVLLGPPELTATVSALTDARHSYRSTEMVANLLKLDMEATKELFEQVIEKLK